MNKISLNKVKFQSLLDWLVYGFRLFCGTLPPLEIKTSVFIMPENQERKTLELARAAFELKKLGGAR